VNDVLETIGAGDLPQVEVYNKIDRTGLEARVERGSGQVAGKAWVSAALGTASTRWPDSWKASCFRTSATTACHRAARGGRAFTAL